jgi:hypothetical protein
MENTNQPQRSTCPICQSEHITDFFEAQNIPAQDGVVWPTREQALEAPTGEIKLVACYNCHYIYNRAYEATKITFLDYDFSLHYSATYQKFNRTIIDSLISNHDLRQKSILGVACGRGHFLVQLCQTAENTGLGIDPSYEPSADLTFDPNQISFEKDYYSDKHRELKFDFITCRHLIDELDHPVEFLKLFQQNLKPNSKTGVYIEVPNAFKTFTNKLIWNIGYAKRSWFTPYSINYLLALAGFKVSKIGKYLDGDYLGIEAIPTERGSHLPDLKEEDTLQVLQDFAKAYQQGRKEWEAVFDHWAKQKYKVALWGAGMRGINFLSSFPKHDTITTVVDINPHRQGKYLPTSAFQVQAPEVLKDQSLDVIIISNATYKSEIIKHARALGFEGTFEVF